MSHWLVKKIGDLPQNEKAEVLREVIKEVAKMPSVSTDKYMVSLMADYIDDARERYKNWGKLVGLSSGYESIDKLTKGFVGGELIIIAGKTSYGKTTLAMNLANKIALQDKRVLFVTLEMTHAELTSRYMYINGGENEDFLRVSTNTLYQKNDELNWQDIDGLVQNAKQELDVDIVIVDHLHYFTRELNNVAEDLGRITKEIKKNAIRHNIPIVLISHVRKGLQGLDTTMDDLRGSSYIAQDADIVLMVGRHPDTGDMLVRIEKNRNRGFDAKDDANVATLAFNETKLVEPKDAWWNTVQPPEPDRKIVGIDY